MTKITFLDSTKASRIPTKKLLYSFYPSYPAAEDNPTYLVLGMLVVI